MARTFTVAPGPHSYPGHTQLAIQAHDMTKEECERLRLIVTNNWMNSDDYKMKEHVSPFLQGYAPPADGRNDGWVLVEFWSSDREAIDAYVAHVNKRMNEVWD